MLGNQPGGKVLILEFSQPSRAIKPAYDLYSFKVLPLLGKLVAQDPESYQYLAESIRMRKGGENNDVADAAFEAALEAGCDGVISSGLEAPTLRRSVDDRLIVVTPGIRPVDNRPEDDQKRVVTVQEAFGNGADYIVVGRPIRDAADPRLAAESIQESIAGVFGR